MSYLKFLVIIFLFCVFYINQGLKAQSQPGNEQKFVVGAYMHSTPWPRVDSIYYNFPDSALFSLWRAKALGINTAMVFVRQPEKDEDIFYVGNQQDPLRTNMGVLEEFPNVIAMNQYSAYRLLLDVEPSPPNKTIRNFDYIYFYSGAYYSKWDATLPAIPTGELGLKHNFGSRIFFNGKYYWSSGTGHPVDLLVKGPNYFQETRYRSSKYPHPWANEVQTYEVNFSMKLKNNPLPEEENDPMCEIIVWVKYLIDGIEYQEALESKTLKVGEIGIQGNQILSYNYENFCQNAFSAREQTSLCPPGSKELVDVEFRVKYLNPNHELLIDFIEIYDIDIWWNRLRDEELQEIAREKIATYLNKFKSVNIQFYKNNLKYFFGVDEPHTVDAYIPHAFVQSVLDSLNNAWAEGAPLLFTHFMPEWNGYRNDAKVIPPFVNIVKPKPFHFYYPPFYHSVHIENSLEFFRNVLTQAKEAVGNDDFWVTIEVWEDPEDFLDWRQPTPAELNASVMLALAHGAKGIFYEPFYSYGTVKGLLEPEEPYEPKDIGIQARDFINPRLNGKLGNTLLGLNYTGNYLQHKYFTPSQASAPPPSVSDYLSIWENTYIHDVNWHAGFFERPNHFEDRYFLLVNLLPNTQKLLKLRLQDLFKVTQITGLEMLKVNSIQRLR